MPLDLSYLSLGAFLDFSLVFYGTDIPPDSDVKGSMASSSSTSTPILTTDVDQNFGSPHQNNQVPRDVPSFGESDFLLSNVQNPLPGPNPLKSFEFPSFSIDTGSSSAPFLPGSAIGAISDLDGRRISNFGMVRGFYRV